MFQRRIPEWLRHAPTPGVRGFAALQGFESIARGILISVFPITVYSVFRDALVVSKLYFLVGIISLLAGLTVPIMTRVIPRRWTYTIGALMFVTGSGLAATGTSAGLVAAMFLNAMAVVTVFICTNAYVLDYIGKRDLGRAETLRLFYSALGWTIGPAGGVWLLHLWPPAPFLVAMAAALAMLAMFWWMRLGNGKVIARAKAPAVNPLAYLGRFFAQPRLVAGWLFAVLRSCGWWVYVVYVPIFAVESGLGEQVGGITLSISNGLLFLSPLMLKVVQWSSIRAAVRGGFLLSAACFIAAGLLQDRPPATIGVLMLGSLFLILLDICAGLPFLMAVRPSERTEMSAIYASYRDVSGILSPGVAWLVLLAAPLAGVFIACGGGLLVAWALAARVHPRLGMARGGVRLRRVDEVV
ncbi:MAG: MFS transporter [Rhodobacteraceae bacterium]|nr:MFS transporter [Paracoccaceae bacterium]